MKSARRPSALATLMTSMAVVVMCRNTPQGGDALEPIARLEHPPHDDETDQQKKPSVIGRLSSRLTSEIPKKLQRNPHRIQAVVRSR
jgi:hypothetical protein